MSNKPIRRIAIIGTGVIGASWTALFLAKGLQVKANGLCPVLPRLQSSRDATWAR